MFSEMFQPPAGVDAYDLARRSGVLPSRTLRGLSDNTAGAIAEYDPEPITSSALKVISTIQGWFGGTGHLDANVITPIQNRVVSDVIAPISAVINSPQAASLSLQSLQQMYTAVTNTQSAWLSFLHNTHWTDPRAAQQAEATLAQYFSNEINWLQNAMANASTSIGQIIGGVPSVPGLVTPSIPGQQVSILPPASGGISTAGFSTLLPVAIGVVALFLFSRKGR